MKTFKLVPLILAGLCGYIHTVINRRFGEIGDLVQTTTAGNGILDNNDAPAQLSSRSRKAAPLTTGTSALQSALDESMERPSTRKLDIGLLQGPAVDEMEQGKDDFQWKRPTSGEGLPANSEEFQQRLLQFTLNLLPHHTDAATGGGEPNNSNHNSPSGTQKVGEGAKKDDDLEADDLQNPKPYEYNQIDIIVPASGQDDRLRAFADNLGVAIASFENWYETERQPAVSRTLSQEEELSAGGEKKSEEPNMALKFRLLITRYPADAQKTEEDFENLHNELAEKTKLSKDNIVMVRVGHDAEDAQEHPLKFNRAHARNVLHQNACHGLTCIVTAMDVDMQVLPIFFHRALRGVKPYVKAYFPIVFSEFNPETVQLVQDFLHPAQSTLQQTKQPQQQTNPDEEESSSSNTVMLEPFSRHRGLWRDFGYGMYVLAGVDAERFRFNEEYQGWGHEDNDFYKLVHNSMRVDRQREHGLIHAWHPKNCDPGKDIITEQQWVDCLRSRDVMEGSTLGLLLRPPLPIPDKLNFPGLAKKEDDKSKGEGTDDDDPGDDVGDMKKVQGFTEIREKMEAPTEKVDAKTNAGKKDKNSGEKEEAADHKPDENEEGEDTKDDKGSEEENKSGNEDVEGMNGDTGTNEAPEPQRRNRQLLERREMDHVAHYTTAEQRIRPKESRHLP